MLCNELFLLGRAHSCYKGCSQLRARICWGYVHPSRVANDYPVLFLGYRAGKEAVALSVNKMGAFYDGECPPSLFSRVSMDLGVMMPVIFVMVSFWATSILYASFLDDLVDIVLTLLREREDVRFTCCSRLEWVNGM